MTSFSSSLGSTLVLSGTVHPIVSAAFVITTSSHSSSNALRSMDDFVHYMVMVLVGGIDGVVGWRAKALGWKEEIWGWKVDDSKRQQITFPLAPLCLL